MQAELFQTQRLQISFMNTALWKPIPTWQLLILLFTPMIVYANTLTAGFVYDDVSITVMRNPFLQGEVSAWDVLFWDRPLREYTYWLDHKIWGWEPLGYHLQNMFWHTANVFLVLILLSQIGIASQSSFWCALCFAVHPINTEAVAWVSGRKDLLCLFFELLACILFIRSYQLIMMKWMYGLSLLAFVLALLSKQVAVVLPGLLILCLWFLSVQQNVNIDWKRWLRWVLPYGLILALSLFFYFDILTVLGIVQERGTFYDPSATETDYTLLSALLTPMVTWLKSWQLLVIPYDLIIDREMEPIISFFDWRWFAGFLLGGTMFAISILNRKQYPHALFGLLWFTITWFPLSGFIPIGYLLADRYLYIPGIGFCIFAVVMIQSICSIISSQLFFSKHKLFLIAINIILAVLAVRTIARNVDWQDELSLWNSALAHYPNNPSIYFNIGNHYWDHNQMDEAYQNWERALEIDPKYEEVWLNMGIAKKNGGDVEKAKEYYFQALTANPQYGTAHFNIAKLLEEQQETDQAIQHFQHAARYLFGKRNAAQLQALACYHAARLLHQTGNTEQALVYIKRGLSLSQHHAPSFALYGMLLPQNPNAARDAFLQSITIAPGYSAAHFNLGVLEWVQGNYDIAHKHWETAISLDPALLDQIEQVKNQPF